MYMSMLNSRVDKRETAHWLGVMFSPNCQEFNPWSSPLCMRMTSKVCLGSLLHQLGLSRVQSPLSWKKKRRSEFPCWDFSCWWVKAIFQRCTNLNPTFESILRLSQALIKSKRSSCAYINIKADLKGLFISCNYISNNSKTWWFFNKS